MDMKKVRIGVLGAYRGESMISYCRIADNAELVAICDIRQDFLDDQKAKNKEFPDIQYFTDFDEFLKYDMDAVVLANYAHEHAPFAIKAMKAGKHVFSEVLPVYNMAQAVELVETVEQTGKIYCYGENYCYMAGPYEMRKLYREGKIGEFEYGEGEYIHNCEPIWHEITYGDPNHWRNRLFYSTFYCTHSIGPIIHITGLRPVEVTGFESTMNERNLRDGCLGGQFGIEMIKLENGGIIKSIHGNLYRNSIWYSIYGSKGRLETAREDADAGIFNRIYINRDEESGAYDKLVMDTYEVEDKHTGFGHGGSDYYTMYNFVEKILGNPDTDCIDVYEALDMFLPGHFAYRSILAGGIPMKVPNLREPAERDQYRYDVKCCDATIASGEDLFPSSVLGTPDIPCEVYEGMAKKWDETLEKRRNPEKK